MIFFWASTSREAPAGWNITGTPSRTQGSSSAKCKQQIGEMWPLIISGHLVRKYLKASPLLLSTRVNKICRWRQAARNFDIISYVLRIWKYSFSINLEVICGLLLVTFDWKYNGRLPRGTEGAIWKYGKMILSECSLSLCLLQRSKNCFLYIYTKDLRIAAQVVLHICHSTERSKDHNGPSRAH
jgi:hypothetical protein